MSRYSPYRRYSCLVIMMLAICIVLAVAFDAFPHFLDHRYLWLRLACLGALISGGIWLFSTGGDLLLARAFTSWWDPAPEPDGKLDWDMVLNLTLGDLHLDPLSVIPVPRPIRIERDLLMVAAATVVLAYFALGISHLLGDLPTPAPTPPVTANSGGNLAAFLALFAALLSIVFTYHQLRAKVRADNRQAWIAKLRTLIAEVTALSYECYEADDKRIPKLWRELGPKRLEFELMLNPQEKDHRLLMFLVQRLAPAESKIQEFIEDARILADLIRAEPGLKRRDEWNDLLECSDPEKLIGYIVRLSHVVLKREWERVKRAR